MVDVVSKPQFFLCAIATSRLCVECCVAIWFIYPHYLVMSLFIEYLHVCEIIGSLFRR